MTLGDIIREYADEHSIASFLKESGLSKAYTYMLINNKNNNGSPIVPSIETIKKVAIGTHRDFNDVFSLLDPEMHVSTRDDRDETAAKDTELNSPGIGSFRIPVLGRVAAGVPIDAITDIVDYEEIPAEMARHGEYFGLIVKGDSMEPRMYDGDVIIVKKQCSADSGDIVVATVNGDDATCKRYMKYQHGIALVSLNSKYQPMMFSEDDVEKKPIAIWGKVVEIRGKMKGM